MSVAVQSTVSSSVVPVEKGQGESVEHAELPQLRSSNMALDLTKPLPTSLQSDFIPEDVLFALTQPPPARDRLGPPTRYRNLETSEMQTRQRPANIWGFKRREKFDHLTRNPPCACGAGKDISFLYDVPQKTDPKPRPDKIDKSQMRREAMGEEKKKINLPDTLIPEEYHIIRNKGVLGIEYFEDKYSIRPEDHDKHLVTFPSLRPNKRSEVVQLKKTLDDMLDKAGVNDFEVEVKGPTQMHNLLELIKKEQNIYNIVFHEIIRQVSVECSERGELLAELRQRYSDLLSKIPHQIKSLHEEVMAQRALDRRLTEELMRFKTTISVLTNELSDVKEHDRKVTREAHQAQENLKAALAEAQKNASLLAEYHDLYELQRKRLERSVFMLTDEKEIWSTAAYSLALKVTEESKLTTAKRLHLSEKAWAKLANHFTILLSDKDTEVLTSIQASVERWRDLIEDFDFLLRRREDEMREELATIKTGIHTTLDDFKRACFNDEGLMMRPPDVERTKNYLSSLQQWSQHLNSISELFGGDVLLGNQESIRKIQQQMEGWTDAAIKVFGRHRGLDGKHHQEQDRMMALNEEHSRRSESELSDGGLRFPHHDPCHIAQVGVHLLFDDTLTTLVQELRQSVATTPQSRRKYGCGRDRGREGSGRTSASSASASRNDESDIPSPGPQLEYLRVDYIAQRRKEIERLLKQLQTRITGENGVAGGVINLSNAMENWETRLRTAVMQSTQLKEAEWGIFYLILDEWAAALDSVTACVGSAQPEELRDALPTQRIEVQECVKKTQKWVTTASNSVDSEDAKMMEMVSTLHSEMVQWMVQLLLRLAPDMEGNSQEAAELALLGSCSVAQLTQNAKSLFERLTKFSMYIRICCDSIVTENTQKRMENLEDNADHELKELGRLQFECDQWVKTAKLLLVTLTGESSDALFPEPVLPPVALSSEPVAATPLSDNVVFHDHEKLQSESESTTEPTTSESAQVTAPAEAESSVSQAATEEAAPPPSEREATPPAEATPTTEEETPRADAAQDEEQQEASKEEEAAEEREADAEVQEVTKSKETFEVLGEDDNTHKATMEVTARTPPPPQQGPPTNPRTAGLDTQQAFQALAAVDSLQSQLLTTEERAQAAEERANDLDVELTKQRETIRALERRLAQMEAAGQRSESVAKTPTPTPVRVPATPTSLASTASPAPSSSQADGSSKKSGSKSKKKGSKKD